MSETTRDAPAPIADGPTVVAPEQTGAEPPATAADGSSDGTVVEQRSHADAATPSEVDATGSGNVLVVPAPAPTAAGNALVPVASNPPATAPEAHGGVMMGLASADLALRRDWSTLEWMERTYRNARERARERSAAGEGSWLPSWLSPAPADGNDPVDELVAREAKNAALGKALGYGFAFGFGVLVSYITLVA